MQRIALPVYREGRMDSDDGVSIAMCSCRGSGCSRPGLSVRHVPSVLLGEEPFPVSGSCGQHDGGGASVLCDGAGTGFVISLERCSCALVVVVAVVVSFFGIACVLLQP